MDCPVCTVPMIVVEHGGIELDYCIECKGIWFDAGELSLLLEKLDVQGELPDVASLPKAESGEKARRCPRCPKYMDKVHLGMEPRVLVDRCPSGHGLWFDAGELGRVVEQYAVGLKPGEDRVIRFLGEVFVAKGGEG